STSDEESIVPRIRRPYPPADRKPRSRPDWQGEIEVGQHPGAPILRKEIRDDRRSNGRVACLANSDQGPRSGQRAEGAGKARPDGRQAPDQNAERDQQAPWPAISKVPSDRRRGHVDNYEDASEESRLGVINSEIFFHQRDDPGQ